MRRYIFLILLVVFGYIMGTHLYDVAAPHHLLFILWTVYCILFMSSLNVLFGQTPKTQELIATIEKLKVMVEAYDKALVDLVKEDTNIKKDRDELVSKVAKLSQLIKFAEQASTHALGLTPNELEVKGLPNLVDLRKRIQELRNQGLIP